MMGGRTGGCGGGGLDEERVAGRLKEGGRGF